MPAMAIAKRIILAFCSASAGRQGWRLNYAQTRVSLGSRELRDPSGVAKSFSFVSVLFDTVSCLPRTPSSARLRMLAPRSLRPLIEQLFFQLLRPWFATDTTERAVIHLLQYAVPSWSNSACRSAPQ